MWLTFVAVVLIAALRFAWSLDGAAADQRRAFSSVAGGQVLGGVLLVAAAIVVALLATPVPSGLLAYLGVIPLMRGLRQLLAGSVRPPLIAPAPPLSWFEAVKTTVVGGGDTCAVVMPLFASLAGSEIIPLASTMMLAIAVTVLLAPVVAARPELAAALRRGERRFSPWALVGVGGHLLYAGGLFIWLFLPHR